MSSDGALPKPPDGHRTARTTIGIKASTKLELDRRRAPGQCYDGFLCQLMNDWDRAGGRAGINPGLTPINEQTTS
jgi:hypothetical protein